MTAAAKRGRQATGGGIPDHLPHYLTNLIGREAELVALKSLLAHSRMVTLTGPGGAGKSRLAAELGRACLELWPAGAWWVELGPVNDPRQVAGAVVTALELPGHGTPQDVVIAWLAAKRALLMLDNCEHLVAACARFCQAALERCPQLTIVASSREALGVPGETRWAVSSMRSSDAVQLFEARARLVVPDFKVAAPNLHPVTEICERVDRLPLAIELAAARVDMMTEQEILSQLTDRFQLLRGGNRTAPERQRTMSATIDWSYRLLTEGEALLFRRLSVFRGGFDFEGARVVCGDRIAGSVLDFLTGLVQKSMVVAERTAGSGTRYRLLESQLAYAEDLLREANEAEPIRRRHYEYFLNCLITKTRNPALAQPLPGVADRQWIAREVSNLWAAMGWAENNADDLGLSLAAYLSFVHFGDVAHSRSLLADLLDRSREKGVPRVYALRSAAALAAWQGDNEAAVRAAEAALVLARELGDHDVLAYTLTVAAVAHEAHDELDTAVEMYEEAKSHLRGSGNLPLVTQITMNLGLLEVHRGDYVAARDILVESVGAARVEGDLMLHASGLNGLAWAQLGLNEPQAADASFKEALAVSSSFMDNPEIISDLHGLLCLAEVSGNDQRALRLAAAANRLSGEWSVRSEPWMEIRAEESQRRSRSRLGTPRSEDAWKEGWAMTADQLIDYALGESEPRTVIDAGLLSRRQQEVATLVAAGLTNRQIAERLFIAERSAEGHVERIRNKLGVRSRTEVATWAVEHGLKGGT
jgi:predicted ATPase/DNA-binding CsgD family transcriptional regulator